MFIAPVEIIVIIAAFWIFFIIWMVINTVYSFTVYNTMANVLVWSGSAAFIISKAGLSSWTEGLFWIRAAYRLANTIAVKIWEITAWFTMSQALVISNIISVMSTPVITIINTTYRDGCASL